MHDERGQSMPTLLLLSASACLVTSCLHLPQAARPVGREPIRSDAAPADSPVVVHAQPSPETDTASTARGSDVPPDASVPTPFDDVVLRTEPRVFEETSAGGRRLCWWSFGSGAPVTLVLGGQHGYEVTPAEFAYRLIQHLEEDPSGVSVGTIVVAPLVDPDGLVSRRRGNDHGVDLNRNYPARNWHRAGRRHGYLPVCEPETRFVLHLMATYNPACIISVHAPLGCVNFDGPARTLAKQMSAACGLPARGSIGYPTPGSLGSYAGADLGIPTITLELRSKRDIDPSMEVCRSAVLEAHAWCQATARVPPRQVARVFTEN
jgi:protein MpaA